MIKHGGRWKGGISIAKDGRKRIRSSASEPFRFEYVLIAEKALGKPLPIKARVHHVDGDPTNNANGNLVICQDQAYHMLLHQRGAVLVAGGNPNTDRLCRTCAKPQLASEFYKRPDRPCGKGHKCRTCYRKLYQEKIHQQVRPS